MTINQQVVQLSYLFVTSFHLHFRPLGCAHLILSIESALYKNGTFIQVWNIYRVLYQVRYLKSIEFEKSNVGILKL